MPVSRVIAVCLALAACGDNTRPELVMQSGSRLQLITYELADGTRDFDRTVFHDSQRDEDCTVMLLSSGERHCIPTSAGGTTVFTDSACQKPVGVMATEEPPGYFLRSFTLNGMTRPSRLYRPGGAIAAPAQRWEQQDSFCFGPYPADPLFYFGLAEEIPTDSFVTVRVTTTLENDRLTLAIDGSDDGWRMPGAITDHVLEVPCTLQPSANASEAPCIPDLPTTTYYANADCSAPLVTADRTLLRIQETGCTSVVARGGLIGGQVYEQLGESCVAVVAPPQSLYTAGEVTPVATLARAEVPPDGERLVPIELMADEVHERDVYLHDRDLEADCRVTLLDGSYACVPFAPLTPVVYFTDAACTTPHMFAFVPSGACDIPARFAADAVGFYRIGALYPDPIYELTTGDRCAAYAPPARFAVHTAEPVFSTAFVPATRD